MWANGEHNRAHLSITTAFRKAIPVATLQAVKKVFKKKTASLALNDEVSHEEIPAKKRRSCEILLRRTYGRPDEK
jgi:hypothetical protein